MRITIRLTTLALIVGVAGVSGALQADSDRRDDSDDKGRGPAPVDFAREILPVLSNKCFVCHGQAGKKRDVLRLDSFAAASRDLGGHRAIDPAAPEKSEILVRIHDPDNPMPPKDSDKQLTQKERDLLSRWVTA